MKQNAFKKIADHIMDMHLQAMIPWLRGQCVLYAEMINKEITMNNIGHARKAQKVVDKFLWQMVYGKSAGLRDNKND